VRRRLAAIGVLGAVAVAGCGSSEPGPSTVTEGATGAIKAQAKQGRTYRDTKRAAQVWSYFDQNAFLTGMVDDAKVSGSTVQLVTTVRDEPGTAVPDVRVLCQATLSGFSWARRVTVPSESGRTVATGRRGGRCTVRAR
jgi:hypothetical protein